MVDFPLDTMSAHRLEARAAANNGRGHGVQRNAGAMQAHRPLVRNGQYLDQAVWSILDSDWRQAKAVWGPKVH